MPRPDPKACCGILLSAIVLVHVGCSSRNDGPGASSRTSGGTTAGTAAGSVADPGSTANPGPRSRLLADWPEPAAVLLISGQMDGYLEPCGCTEGQQGGLIRRLDFVERLQGQGWPLGLIDLGGLVKDPAAARGGFDQARLKFGIALKALVTMDYDAIALSAEDLKVGVSEAFGQFLNNLGEHTKILAANVTPGPGYESLVQTSRIIKAGPLKLGVTAVLSPESIARLSDPDLEEVLPEIQPPEEILGKVLAELEPVSDHQVLMVQAPPEEAKRLALAYPGFEVVVATSPFADPLEREPLLLNDGKTMLVQVGRKGKSMGAVGFFPDPTPAMRFHLVSLNGRFNGPGTAVKRVIEDEFREGLKAAGIVESFPKHDFVSGAPGATYVGAETCKRCHPNTFMKWSTTKHAQAFEALLHDPKPNVIYDAECVTCHTTGFEYTSGYRSVEATPHLRGNQCENCHGPASRHIAEPDNLEFRNLLRITADQADKSRTCIRCHDEDNSPKFDFTTYWSQVVHNDMDTYNDPKVHQGITPKVARGAASE